VCATVPTVFILRYWLYCVVEITLVGVQFFDESSLLDDFCLFKSCKSSINLGDVLLCFRCIGLYVLCTFLCGIEDVEPVNENLLSTINNDEWLMRIADMH
jgi:hypothetical protein